MSEPSAAERRLAAILVADVSGYSRLVHADEAATVARLAALRREIDSVLEGHGGRVVSSAGDGFLADFGSALDAVAAALEIQSRIAGSQQELPESEQIRFRIGLNLGDVLVQEDDLFGDAINVAARLQELATPGGICASRALRDGVRGRFPCAFERIGKRQVKNIARPVTVYRLSPAGARRPTRWVPAAIVATLILVAAAALWASLPLQRPTAPSGQATVSQPTTPTGNQRPTVSAPRPEPRAAGGESVPKPSQSVEGTAGDTGEAAARNQGGR